MPVNYTFEFGRDFKSSLSLSTKADLSHLLSDGINPLIIDQRVYDLYPDLFAQYSKALVLKLPAGEASKTGQIVNDIYDFLLECKAGRNTLIYVICGGTITDPAAFAISTFKRGCRLALVPSTLLGMVDASLGGKTGVNNSSLKNLIGSFYPAEQIIIVPELLNTLPEAELRNGLAEMLKLQFIQSDLPEPVTGVDRVPNPEVIMEYAKAKLSICAQDLHDKGSRRLLNLGHTFGHALESYTDYATPHGEAVAWGIAVAARFSLRLGYINRDHCDEIIDKLQTYNFKTELDSALKPGFLAAFPKLAAQDKKGDHNLLTLILFTEQDRVSVIEDIELSLVNSHLADCI